jgi:hypothetical protein
MGMLGASAHLDPPLAGLASVTRASTLLRTKAPMR